MRHIFNNFSVRGTHDDLSNLYINVKLRLCPQIETELDSSSITGFPAGELRWMWLLWTTQVYPSQRAYHSFYMFY